MTDRQGPSDRELERFLTDLGRHLGYPETSGLAESVAERLRGEPAPRRGVLVRLPRPRSLPRAVVIAAAILLLLAGAAVAVQFAIRGVDVSVVPSPPEVPSVPPGENLALGEPVSLEEARVALPFPLLVPEAAGFEAPDAVYLDETIAPGRRATLVYVPRPGLPRDGRTGVGMLLTQFLAHPDSDGLLGKEAGPGTDVEQVRVGSVSGLWIEGAPHSIVYLDERGAPFPDTLRLAGNVLLWQAGDVTLRLEADLTKAEAIRIAESVR